jgi:DNA-binding CsgD family transcriptional regulator
MISKSYEWDSIDEEKQNIIIDRLNMKDVNRWFNISKNLGRIYNEVDSDYMYQYIIQSFENSDSNLLVNIIFETLVYNGILTYFKYNPNITDNNLIPNKNKEYKKWEKYMLENVSLDEYKDSYHFFSNKKYSNEDLLKGLSLTEYKIIDLIAKQKKSKEIGELLFISDKTVRNHRYNIIKKLNIPNDNNSLLKWALTHMKESNF